MRAIDRKPWRPIFFTLTALIGGLLVLCANSIAPAAPLSAEEDTAKTPTVIGSGQNLRNTKWFKQISAAIVAEQYEFQTSDSNGTSNSYLAGNPAQGLQSTVSASGVSISTPTDRGAATVSLTLLGYGRLGGAIHDSDFLGAQRHKNSVAIFRGNITEWYVNTASGLEQGFTVFQRAGGGGRAVVKMRITAGESTRYALDRKRTKLSIFYRDSKTPTSVYKDLIVIDSLGRKLPSTMRLSREGSRTILSLVFNDRRAVYPITVDPLATSTNWSSGGDNKATAGYGTTVASAGDINGDGYDDAIVGAPQYDSSVSNVGKVYVYHGASAGLSTSASWASAGSAADGNFGKSVASAGDVDGNGYSDIIVGQPGPSTGSSHQGKAHVYLGSSSGLSSQASWSTTASSFGTSLGDSVSTAGDVNNDGYSDVVVGSPRFSNGGMITGKVEVFYGSRNGLSTAVDWVSTGEDSMIAGRTGTSVASAGDVNADGFSDIVVGAPNYNDITGMTGRAFVYLGSPAGLPSRSSWAAKGQANSLFGTSVASAGDVNADGRSDIIVGAPKSRVSTNTVGQAFVYYGNGTALSNGSFGTLSPSGTIDIEFGGSVAGAADINGDGYGDVIVGAPKYNSSAGRAYLFRGSATGISSAASWANSGFDQAGAQFGGAVASAGDVNGDGYSEVIVGSKLYDGTAATDAGKANLFMGSGEVLQTGSNTIVGSATYDADGLGSSIASAGDVNGDGFTDVIVGAPSAGATASDLIGKAFLYLGSAAGLRSTASWTSTGNNQLGAKYGASVASAGDVNNDGYGDVVVGASRYATSASVYSGKAYVYVGGATGLSTSPAWTSSGESNGGAFGSSVASAGDVNADGYSDLLIGAPNAPSGSNYTGKAYLYKGSPTGLGGSYAWSSTGDGQHLAGFGNSVAGIGDTDRDGYSDVLIGARSHDCSGSGSNCGRVYLFKGSSTLGLGSTAYWTSGGQNGALYAYGTSVSGAGDVNGDGYSDFIVGAPGAAGGVSLYAGRVYLYLGHSVKPSLTPAWSVTGDANSQLGSSVAFAGDVNGDGLSDVVAGAPFFNSQTGKVHLFVGSRTTYLTDGGWTYTGGRSMGRAVSSAGDVNGDGFSDVAIGAANASGLSGGWAGLTYGGGGKGVTILPRQMRSDSSRQIHPGLRSNFMNGFDATIFGSSPFGRSQVKWEIDVRPLDTPFAATQLRRSDRWQSTTVRDEQVLSIDTVNLNPGVKYKWRGRIVYDTKHGFPQGRSRWYSIPGNALTEVDFVTPPTPSKGTVTITQSGGSTLVAEGATADTYSVQLSGPPAANVVIFISTNPTQLLTSTNFVAFTPSNWWVPQTVTVVAVNDTADETSPHVSRINHYASSADPLFDGASAPYIDTQIIDNDPSPSFQAGLTSPVSQLLLIR